MSGEPNASCGDSGSEPTGATPVGMLVGAVSLILCGGALFLFGQWLLATYGPSLDWPAYPAPAITLGVIPAMLAMHGCRKARWGEILTAFLAVATVTVALGANIVAAAVILWAYDPAIARGQDGFFAAGVAGVFLSLPVAFGAAALMQRWLKSDMPWRERFRNDGPHGPRGLRILLLATVLLLAWLAASEFTLRLATAYPVVGATHFFAQIFLVFMALIFVATASLPDLRSVLRTLLAALVLFEAILALAIAGTAVLAALQSDNILPAMTVELLLLAPVYLGASILATHRPGGRGDEAANAAEEEEAA